jgi:hypothetical protein
MARNGNGIREKIGVIAGSPEGAPSHIQSFLVRSLPHVFPNSVVRKNTHNVGVGQGKSGKNVAIKAKIG